MRSSRWIIMFMIINVELIWFAMNIICTLWNRDYDERWSGEPRNRKAPAASLACHLQIIRCEACLIKICSIRLSFRPRRHRHYIQRELRMIPTQTRITSFPSPFVLVCLKLRRLRRRFITCTILGCFGYGTVIGVPIMNLAPSDRHSVCQSAIQAEAQVSHCRGDWLIQWRFENRLKNRPMKKGCSSLGGSCSGRGCRGRNYRISHLLYDSPR